MNLETPPSKITPTHQKVLEDSRRFRELEQEMYMEICIDDELKKEGITREMFEKKYPN